MEDDYDSDEFEQAVAAVEEEMENKIAAPQIEEEIETDGEGIITQFNPDHIITDPGLRIPIDRFSIDIRSEVRRAFIDKGLTQPMGYNFPKTNKKRCFQKSWFKQHPWLEYSVEKDRPIIFIVIFSSMIEWMTNLDIMSLQHWGLIIGRMHICRFQNMME